MKKSFRAPWWKFWDPLSGIVGGLIFGTLMGMGLCVYEWLLLKLAA